jgi:UDP-N-acetylmuramoylalanine--D-glutamate ligase
MKTAKQKIDAVVIGLGKTGMSCVRFLKQQGLNVVVTDTRHTPPCLSELEQQYQDVDFYPGDIDAELCKEAEQIVVSPGVSLQHPAIQQAIQEGKPVHGDIELFCQHARAPIVAISGSNGKSTVTTLVAEMAEAAGKHVEVGGNLGTPALELLQAVTPEFYVLELSSFQLDSTFSLNAYASVVLNVSSDHMDRYSNLEAYASSKQRIYQGNGVMVVNLDDEYVKQMFVPDRKCSTYSLHTDEQADFGLYVDDEQTWLCHGDKQIIAESELAIKGKHNVANALAAIALAYAMRIPESAIVKTLKAFQGLPHRCQYVANVNGVDWINDSKATNVGATIAAIEGLNKPQKLILIAGGDSKGADLTSLLPVLNKHIKHVLLMGVDASRFASLFQKDISFELVQDMEEAVNKAQQIAATDDTVLLAPACASLDMFENYQQRGDVFVAAVQALGETS